MGGVKSNDLPGIGERLRYAREATGLSQGQVAKLMGLHRPAISEMESERRKVSAGELKELARYYKVSVEWLTGEPVERNQKLKIAARKLSGLRDEDVDMVMRIVDSLHREHKRAPKEPK